MLMSFMIDKKDMAIVMALGLLLSAGLAMSQDTEQIKQEAIASDQASQEDTEELEQEVIANEQEAQEAMEELKQEVIASAQSPQETEQGAAQDAQDGNVTASNLEGVFWTLDSLLNSEGETVSVLPNTEVTTLFQDGRVSGNAGCNNYAAEYESIGYNLTIGTIISTLMMCDENISNQETDFLSDLGNAASYSISGNQLRIMNSNGTAILDYSAVQPMPLVGTLWEMTSYNNGMGGLVSAQADINVTALFGKDGSLEGFAGCNQYHAAYQTNDSQIKIGPTATTRMMCEETVMEMEMDYLNALQSAASYEVQAEDLTLFDANDTKAVTFQSMR